ncbi:MAG: FtsX-like permease family protein [Abditibacteriaceae bacterium]
MKACFPVKFPKTSRTIKRACAAAVLLIPLCGGLLAHRMMAAPQPQNATTVLTLANEAMVARLKTDVTALSKYPSRVPGTPGNLAAAQYVQQQFQDIGLQKVHAESFPVTVPVTQFATLNFQGKQWKLAPVYPNHVVPSSTPPGGITGPLVYAGQGRPRDFNGQSIKDSVVVLDFNSGMNWFTAADLGAKAVIFLSTDSTSRGQAERKYANVPLEMPRFYAPPEVTAALSAGIKKTDGAQLLGQGTVKSEVQWQRVQAKNILGFLPGTDSSITSKPGNTIILGSYYDSMAVTPDIAPGAEASANFGGFLEVARYLKAHPLPYNVLFLADGAHHVALAGMRAFTAKHLVDSTGDGGKALSAEIANYRAFVGLDLTSRTPTVGLFAKGWFYNQMTTSSENILLNQFANYAKAVDDQADTLSQRWGIPSDEFYVDGITGKQGRTWRSYLPSLVALDSEVATMAQLPGISFATANDVRALQDTPYDLPSQVEYSNIATQVNTITSLLGQSAKSMPEMPGSDTFSANFGYIVANAISRDVTQSSSFLPDTPIPDSHIPDQKYLKPDQQKFLQGTAAVAYVSDRSNDYKSYAGVRGAFIERAQFSQGTTKKSDEAGHPLILDVKPVAQFLFDGPRVGDSKGGGVNGYTVDAFSVDRSGHVIFAPDMGAERLRFTPSFRTTSKLTFKDKSTGEYNSNASVMCFKSRGVALYDTLDQRYFSVLTEMNVLDAMTDANPVQYGFIPPQAPADFAEMTPAAVVYGTPGSRFKLLMAAGLLGKRLVIIMTNPKLSSETGKPTDKIYYNGAGVPVPDMTDPTSSVVHVAYQTAQDLWTLDQQRIQLLKGFGISNERVDYLHGAAGCPPDIKDPTKTTCPTTSVIAAPGGAIAAATTALASFHYDQFYTQSRRAFGLESRAYPDVEGTSQDILKGILFYLALLLPFSFFLERLFCGFTDVRKQIMGTSVAFIIAFFSIRFVNPGFELALTPFIILLAFIILALTLVVTLFLSSKFESEIKRLKQGVHFADVGRLSAISAALGLGIANMRRRPTRTALTCITLILLTFTVLSFTSVTASISNFARPYGDASRPPGYAGLMVRMPDWSGMKEVAVTSMDNDFSQRFGDVARRAWYLSRNQTELMQLRVSNVEHPEDFLYAPALVGLTPNEKTIGSPIAKTVVKGRWFEKGDSPNVCLLPRWALLDKDQRTAETQKAIGSAEQGKTSTANNSAPDYLLGLTLQNALGAKVKVAGEVFTVIGVFDDQAFRAARDLDNEQFTPVDYQNQQNQQQQGSQDVASQSGAEPQVQSYLHMDANALLLIPYEKAIMMGGNTRSIAAGFENTNSPQQELNDLMQRAALGIFGATKDSQGKLQAKLYSSVESTSYEGFLSLFIPILIAAAIIANTMLGSVFERTKEISIYSAIGLAPIHVAALFIAEAGVFAVLGSISGYLIAQIVAKVITHYNILPGITLNYSSSSAVLSTMIVMITVLLSTIYPAMAASRMSQPDTERKWQMSDPVRDVWRFQFPFTVSGQQPVGVAMFLQEFFQTHTDTSVGKFYVDDVKFTNLSLKDSVELLNALPPAVIKKRAESQVAGDAADEPTFAQLELGKIAASPDSSVFNLSMRVWLAPFDMGVSQDTVIILMPSEEEGLFELQIRLVRQSGEIAAWKRTNRGFISDLRKQLLLWRTIKPKDQMEYVRSGRAHLRGEPVPAEHPDEARSAV